MEYLGEALINLCPKGVQFKVRGNTYADIIWLSEDISQPSEEATMAERQRLIDEYDAQDYARKRESEYPSLNDFAEAYTEKEIGGNSTKWDAYVINYNRVRTENPKE